MYWNLLSPNPWSDSCRQRPFDLPLLCHKMSGNSWATWDWPALDYFIVSLPWTLWSIGMLWWPLVLFYSKWLNFPNKMLSFMEQGSTGVQARTSLSSAKAVLSSQNFHWPLTTAWSSEKQPNAVSQRTLFGRKSIKSYSTRLDIYMGQ